MNVLNSSAKLTEAAPTSQCGQVPTRRSVVSVGASEQTVVVVVDVVVLLKLSNLRLKDVGSERKGEEISGASCEHPASSTAVRCVCSQSVFVCVHIGLSKWCTQCLRLF